MSKIKELFAEENGDDDLVVTDEEKEYERIYEATKKKMADDLDELKDCLANDAEMERVGDDGGSKLEWRNFQNSCENWSEAFLGDLVTNERIDISDDKYASLVSELGEWLAKELDDYKAELEKEYEQDDLDDWAERQSYNNNTIIK